MRSVAAGNAGRHVSQHSVTVLRDVANHGVGRYGTGQALVRYLAAKEVAPIVLLGV